MRGVEYLYIAMTTTNEVYALNLKRGTISVFANRDTIDLATGLPVGSGLASPDNLAIDHDGNLYIVEDRSGGVDDDIWFAYDRNHDGDLQVRVYPSLADHDRDDAEYWAALPVDQRVLQAWTLSEAQWRLRGEFPDALHRSSEDQEKSCSSYFLISR